MGGDGEDVVGLFTAVCSGMVRGGSTAETERLGVEIGRSLFSMRTAQKWSQSPWSLGYLQPWRFQTLTVWSPEQPCLSPEPALLWLANRPTSMFKGITLKRLLFTESNRSSLRRMRRSQPAWLEQGVVGYCFSRAIGNVKAVMIL